MYLLTLLAVKPEPVITKYNLADHSLIAQATPPEAPRWPVVNDRPKQVSGQGCVRYLRARGYYVPPNPLIFAKYLPVDSTELPPEGIEVTAVSYESAGGHVARAVNRGGKLVTTVDSAGSNRVISLDLYKGYIN